MPMRSGRRPCHSPPHANASSARALSSDLAAVIGPVEHRLALPAPAPEVTRLAVAGDLLDVPHDRPPAPDLARIVGTPPPAVIAAIPLKPAAGILRANPPVAPPRAERLRRVDPEAVQPWIVPLVTQPGAGEPAGR